MPGFNIAGANDPTQKSNTQETRRKMRWAVTALGDVLAQDELVYLQKCSRPKFSYDVAEMHHNQEVAKFAGKQKWDDINFSFYDGEQPKDVSKALATWLSSVTTSWATPGAVTSVAVPNAYKKQGTLEMLDGAGAPTETWTLYGVWPKETNWQDLDYTSNDIAMVDVTVAIDRAIRL